jgi:cysteinyl-tRNA synthetase
VRAIRLHDTRTGEVVPLEPREPGRVGIYACGPTVYGRIHVGNARPFVVFSLFKRFLEHEGYEATFVANITDVNDKIYAAAEDRGIGSEELAGEMTEAYISDTDGLGLGRPDAEPKAVETIGPIIELIQSLVDQGAAYPAGEGDVYFRVSAFDEYGKLSNRALEDMQQGEDDADRAGIKEAPQDFALWKGRKEGEDTSWPSPWGDGRPGWHIECSAMAEEILGVDFDIHGGGADLIFPHHENEIAQSEADAGAEFARIWMHNGMITSGTEKMSKSLGNIVAIGEMAKRVPSEALRLLLLGTHYRAPLDYSSARLDESVKALERIYETLARVGGDPPVVPVDGALRAPAPGFESDFCAAMDDDLNAAKAIGLVFDRVRDLNRALDAGDPSAPAIRAELARVGVALGLMESNPAALLDDLKTRGRERSGISENDITAAIADRNAARARKDFREADAIRDRLKAHGIVLVDGPQGTSWKAG